MNPAPTWIPQLVASPEWLCQEIEVGSWRALFVRCSPAVYRQSLFLDHRLAVDQPQQRIVPLAPLIEAAAGARLLPARFIFHLGHCGSTLVSRALEALQPDLLVLREPLPLLTLATLWQQRDDPLAALDPARYPALERLMVQLVARRYADNQPTVIKLTSNCVALAQRVLTLQSQHQALLLTLRLERFLQVMLRNEQRRAELLNHAPPRLADLHDRLADRRIRLYQLSPGELAAMSWLSLELAQLAAADSQQCLRVDFDRYLAAPESRLQQIAAFFGLQPESGRITEATAGAVARHYAKDPQQPFDAGTRAAQLQASASQHADQISAGLRWAEDIMRRYGIEGVTL